MKGRALTDEQKAVMAAGRKAAAARKALEAAAAPPPREVYDVPDDEAWTEPTGTVTVRVADERRERLLQGIPADIAALITDDELARIEAEERKRAIEERTKKALDTVRTQLRQRARVENDLISPDVIRSDADRKRLAERVKFKVTLPEGGGARGFRVDGRVFQHGQTYTESRAVFESLQANHYQTWLSEVKFRTLDQHKPGQSAKELMGTLAPRFEVVA